MRGRRSSAVRGQCSSLILVVSGVGVLGCGQAAAPTPGEIQSTTSALQTTESGTGDTATADDAGEAECLDSLADDSRSGGEPASVTVDPRNSLAKYSPIAVGLNSAAWDGRLVDAEIPALLRSTGAQILRYPGGSTSDNYHWSSNTADDPGVGGTDPNATFDAYVSAARAGGMQSMITVNYGSGTAQEAADWVRYANRGGPRYQGPVPSYMGASKRGHTYGVRYWEVGNEMYGDGTYGAQWEVNHKSHDPVTYAQGVVSYSAAMKAVDPSVHVGVVLTAPGNWPDGQTSGASPLPWNDTVLPIVCQAADFVVVHWYAQGPTGESDAALLAAPQKGEGTSVSYTPDIASIVATLKSKLNQYCGARGTAMEIMVTETNSVSYNPGKQTTSVVNALFLADQLTTWFENGVTNVDWWAFHNSPFDGNADPALHGDYAFGDYGLLSAGFTSAGGAVEPPANTPFPSYFGMQMLSHLGHRAGDTLVKGTSSNELLGVHSVRQRNGKVNVLLINKDPSRSFSVTVSLAEGRVNGWAGVYRYGDGSRAITTSRKPVRGSSFTITVDPYSLVTVKLP